MKFCQRLDKKTAGSPSSPAGTVAILFQALNIYLSHLSIVQLAMKQVGQLCSGSALENALCMWFICVLFWSWLAPFTAAGQLLPGSCKEGRKYG